MTQPDVKINNILQCELHEFSKYFVHKLILQFLKYTKLELVQHAELLYNHCNVYFKQIVVNEIINILKQILRIVNNCFPCRQPLAPLD